MAAYASLLALARTLHQILTLDRYPNPLDREKIVSLLGKVDFSVNFLEDYSEKNGGTVYLVGNEMRNAAYEAQDIMDSYLFLASRNDFDSTSSEACSVDQDLNLALERINFFWEEAMKIKNIEGTEDIEPITYSSPVDLSSAIKVPAKNMVVGFENYISAINEQLYEDSEKRQIIPIVGMGGIGKTTLARRVYEDGLLSQHFDICAWITVSAEYRKRRVLSGLLHYLMETDDVQCDQRQNDGQLATLVYQNLIGRRYLIVIDDVWDTKAWDDMKMIFPDDGSGSRILITTRLSDVAIHARSSSTNQLHEIKFLDEDQSWELLQERIFGLESCPPQLVEMGKKIASSCGGLPLTIVVVGGMLISKSNILEQELWENVSKNISSTEPTIELQCSKILCLSYDRLPLHLKPCFLYITAFPEDSGIDVSKLIKMWVAEGFLKLGDQSKCMEDAGEGYLEDLVNRNLILVRKKGPDGKIETVGVHDLLREICKTKAEEEGFLHHVSSNRNAPKEANQNLYRRISIHYTQVFWEWRIPESSIRSVLLFSERNLGSRFFLSTRRLSILDAPEVTWPNLSDAIATLFNLRYIAFALNDASCPHGFPTSITKLPNLQTLIAHRTYFRGDHLLQIPYEIWEMPKLRHLITDTPFRLSSPPNTGITRESEIQTLETAIDFKFTEEIIEILVNLKKLRVIFTLCLDHWDDYNLNNLFLLNSLEELQVYVDGLRNPSVTWNHTFPISPKKLTLEGVPWRWDNMTIIGSLPNLQVLQMINIKVTEMSEWTPMEDQFLRLKYFRSSLDSLVKWEVGKEQFPSLESLVLRRAQIDEVPCGIGEIDSLQLIELQFCKQTLVDSAIRIHEQQRENGNFTLQVRVNNSDKHDFFF